jgi:hypothetical protein
MKRITALAVKIAPMVVFPIIALMIIAMAIPLPDPHIGSFWDKLLQILTFVAILITGFIIGAYYGSEFSSRK